MVKQDFDGDLAQARKLEGKVPFPGGAYRVEHQRKQMRDAAIVAQQSQAFHRANACRRSPLFAGARPPHQIIENLRSYIRRDRFTAEARFVNASHRQEDLVAMAQTAARQDAPYQRIGRIRSFRRAAPEYPPKA